MYLGRVGGDGCVCICVRVVGWEGDGAYNECVWVGGRRWVCLYLCESGRVGGRWCVHECVWVGWEEMGVFVFV